MPRLIGPLPTQIHSRQPISLEIAQSYLSAYLSASESKQQLHPDAFLGFNGIDFGSHGPSGGITLHLLRRLERGLAGEYLEPEVDEKGQWPEEALETIQDSQVEDPNASKEWVDPEVYALQQEGAQTPIHERVNYVGGEGKEEIIWDPEGEFESGGGAWGEEDLPQIELSQGVKGQEKKKDKEKAKKDAKKARRKEEQKKRMAKRGEDSD